MFEECTMDIITHLPITERGCDAIATFVDRMSKYVCFVPCKSTISAEELAQLFIATVVSQHGVKICSCVVLVTFTVYVCSVNVRSCLNCVTIFVVDCSCDALLRSTAATKGSL